MTRENAKYILSGLMKSLNEYCGLNDTGFQAFNMAIKALEQEPCEDAVSREAAIDAALSAFSRGLLASPDIRKLPSVTPERKNGKWIEDRCSECGCYVYHGDVRNFCPMCGLDMRVGEDA